jgi:hypothetical protein
MVVRALGVECVPLLSELVGQPVPTQASLVAPSIEGTVERLAVERRQRHMGATVDRSRAQGDVWESSARGTP